MGSILSGVLGVKNEFQARKPVNTFQATSPAAAGTVAQANTQASGGAGPASGTITRQNLLNDQLAAAAAGTGGPSPAEQMLKKATSQNVNLAAGQAASARGVNPALAARMAVDTAAGANQTGAADAATLKANEQIAARTQLGSNLAQTGGLQLGQQGAGTQLLGTAGGLDLGAQGLNEQVAGQNASLDLGSQQLQAGVDAQNADIAGKLAGGVLNGAGAFLGMDEGGSVPEGIAAHGGPLHEYLDSVHAPSPVEQLQTPVFGSENAVPNSPALPGAATPAPGPAAKDAGKGLSAMGSTMQGGDSMQAFQRVTARPVLGALYANGGSIYRDPAGQVPGRAEVAGDSPRNDKVHAMLSPGEIVVPRSVLQGKNAAKKAGSFVASVMRRSGASGRRYAVGGKVAPGPEAAQFPSLEPDMQDLSEGGMVEHHSSGKGEDLPVKKTGKVGTARGLGGSETRRRIKSSGNKPRFAEAE